MEDVYRVSGSLRTSSGEAAAGLLLVVLDEDMLDDDDLIGVGKTGADGSFDLSFLGSEFRQDMFEDEATPDLKIVVSVEIDGVLKAIFARSFPSAAWTDCATDLGEIVLDGVDLGEPVALVGVEALPGYDRRVARLDIDNDMVRHCLAEVAPIVERLTGWSNLLDGVKVEVADSLTPYMLRESLLAAGKDPSSFESRFSAYMANLMQGPGAGCAMYDPHIHTIIIQRQIMKQVGLEGLKIICGHELVHLGQYKYTPGLKEYNLRHLQGVRVDDENVDMEQVQAQGAYMIELEGYAKYIEVDFLHARYYPMALMTYHASIFEKMTQAAMAMLADNVEAARDFKASQYVDGLAIYRERAVGGVPARFHLDVASLPGGAACID